MAKKQRLSRLERDAAMRRLERYGRASEARGLVVLSTAVPNVHPDRLSRYRGQLWIVEKQLENVRIEPELGLVIDVEGEGLLELASRHLGTDRDDERFVYWWLQRVTIPDDAEDA